MVLFYLLLARICARPFATEHSSPPFFARVLFISNREGIYSWIRNDTVAATFSFHTIDRSPRPAKVTQNAPSYFTRFWAMFFLLPPMQMSSVFELQSAKGKFKRLEILYSVIFNRVNRAPAMHRRLSLPYLFSRDQLPACSVTQCFRSYALLLPKTW